MRVLEYRYLNRLGKCACCGKDIERKKEKVFVFSAHKSQTGNVTICNDCVKEMNKLKNIDRYELIEILNQIKEK